MGKQTTVLVTGITGQQGGAVARALLGKGYKVRGVTRDPGSTRARAMQKLGAEIVRGDFAKPGTLRDALAGVDAVFAVSVFFDNGIESEIAQGKALADAALAAGVHHYVFTSVVGAERNTGIPHFDSKGEIESYIKEIGLPYTFLRPVYFMENLFFPQSVEALQQGSYALPLPADLKLQQVAVQDIGNFGALVLSRRDEFIGQAIDIASDDLTGDDVARHLTQSLGKPVTYMQVPMDAIRAMSEEMAIMYQWFIDVGYDVDVAELRRKYPEVGWHSYAQWLDKQDPEVFAPQVAPEAPTQSRAEQRS